MSIQVKLNYLQELLEQVSVGIKNRYADDHGMKQQTCRYGLQSIRDRANLYLHEAIFPTTKDEEWRFTDLSNLKKYDFKSVDLKLLPTSSEIGVSLSNITLPVATKEQLPLRLVFVNGVYTPHLSSIDQSLLGTLGVGLYIGNLTNLPGEYHAKVRDYLIHQSNFQDIFEALNTAGLTDAMVVYLPKNLVVDLPIHLLFVSAPGQSPTLIQPHCIIVAEAHSKATILEDYCGIGEDIPDKNIIKDQPYLTNSVTQILLGENAQINHIRLQRESNQGFHISRTAIAQSSYSRYYSDSLNLGSKLSRHNLEVIQQGSATETVLNGLTMIIGEQISDTHSAIILNHPQGTTRQIHKTIVGDKAHAIFNGLISVGKLAQMTEASQLSRNLLLTTKARVDTKPQLEIIADNVKCSHGATVSQLDDDSLFYLQSRGLDLEDSRTLLINGFAGEIINQLPVPFLRETISRYVACRTNVI